MHTRTHLTSQAFPSPLLGQEGEGAPVRGIILRAAAWIVARRWTIAIALVALAMHYLPVDVSWLALSRDALAHGRWWTLVTGSLLHVSDLHVRMDVLGLLMVGGIFEPRFGRAWPWLVASINIVVGLGALALYPHLPGYCGLSALDQGLLAAGVVALMFEQRWSAAAIIGGTLIAKWTFEVAGGLPLMGTMTNDPLQYGQSVPWAHAIGGATGALAATLVKLARVNRRAAARAPWRDPAMAPVAGLSRPAPNAAWSSPATGSRTP